MKALKGLTAAVFLAAPLLANAYSTWIQTINFDQDPLITTSKSHTFTHDLTQVGFNAATNHINEYALSISIYDDENDWLLDSIFEIAVLGQEDHSIKGGFVWYWTTGTVISGDSVSGLASLNLEGLLSVTVSSEDGDFYLGSSRLTARGNNSASVPEPSSPALLAAGLFGIATMRRSAVRKG